MAKTQLKVGKCERCGNTLIVDIDDEFYCNSWRCFAVHDPDFKRREDLFDIKGEEKIVHGIYHED